MADILLVGGREKVVDSAKRIHRVNDEDVSRFHASVEAGPMNHLSSQNLS